MIKSRASPIMGASHIGSEYDRNLNQHSYYQAPLYFMKERVDTENHPGWQFDLDGGGFFDNQKSEYRSHPSGSVKISASSGGSNPFLSYQGRMACSVPSGSVPIGDGDPWGAQAYNAMKPTKPDYSLANMVYELKDLPHMLLSFKDLWSLELIKKPLGLWRQSGNQWLSSVFGWSPIVSDILTLIDKQQKIQKRVNWLIRNNGKWVPREVKLVDKLTQSDTGWINDYGALTPLFTTSYYFRQPRYRDTVWARDRVWATALFRYFLPDPGPGVSLNDSVKTALRGGSSISAANLYAAIPWSWLVDWCFNTQTLLSNMDSGIADRLAAKRFYIMREQEVIKIRRADAVMRSFGGNTGVSVEASAWRRDLHQTRLRGSPFYPGNPNNLSGMQLAILGALGLSRL
jgi:hypothetical protein